MRFALIGPSAPLRGGIAQYHDRLATALAARGHAVDRLSFRRLYPRLFFPGRTQYEPTPQEPAQHESKTAGEASPTRAATGRLAPAEPILDSLGPRTWLATAKRAAAAEVALVEWWHPFFAPALAVVTALLRRRGVPAVFICHNLEPHERIPGGGSLAALALGRAAGFIAQSGADAAELSRRYPGRPVRTLLPPAEAPPPCPHGDDRSRCERALGLAPAPRRALFFGYVREYKGLPTLLEALPLVPPDVQLVVAGEIYHHDAAHYRELAARAGVAERVVLLDRFVATSEVACCFGASDVVVLPYWDASQSAVVPLAMACGRAVVATTVGGLPELVRHGETGLLVPPRDPRALAAAIVAALIEAPRLGRAAALAARSQDWDSAAVLIGSFVAASICGIRAPC